MIDGISKLLGFVVAAAVLAFGAWAVIEGINHDPALVGSLATGLLALVAAIAQRRWEKRQELERLHRGEMAPIYEELIDRLKDMEKLAAVEQNEEFFKSMTTKLMVHGSPQVIKAWLRWRRCGPQERPEDLRLLVAYEQLLRAIRADLGHDDSSLASGDLLRVYVNDLDESLPDWEASRLALLTSTRLAEVGR